MEGEVGGVLDPLSVCVAYLIPWSSVYFILYSFSSLFFPSKISIVVLQDADDRRRFLKEEYRKPDREGPRTHRTLHDFAESNYLSQLGFVRTNPKI